MKFSDFFPIPSYLKIPAVGFDISDQSLKYIEFCRKKKATRLLSFGRKDIPPGIIESGQIKKQNEFTDFLKTFRQDVKNDYVIIALPEEKTFIGTIRLPLMKEGEIKESLGLQLEEHIPLQAEETIFDYELKGKDVAKEGSLEVFFTAAPIEAVRSYRDALVGAGFVPLIFETEPHALVRALIPSEEKSTQMILDFGKTRTSFIIATGQKVELSWTIKVAGEAINLAISKTLSVGPEQGTRLKNEVGLLKGREDGRIFSAVLPVVSAIKDEAAKHLTYWRTYADQYNKPNREIEKIILCGGDSNLKGLVEYLSNALGLPVASGNPWLNVASFEDYIPEIEFREALMYATAIGLALRAV